MMSPNISMCRLLRYNIEVKRTKESGDIGQWYITGLSRAQGPNFIAQESRERRWKERGEERGGRMGWVNRFELTESRQYAFVNRSPQLASQTH